jgi:hypothetical protein
MVKRDCKVGASFKGGFSHRNAESNLEVSIFTSSAIHSRFHTAETFQVPQTEWFHRLSTDYPPGE